MEKFRLLCHNYILKCLVDSLYNVYYKTTTAKELWKSLECKYKTEDASTKKFVVARFLDYKMNDSKNMINQKNTYTPDSAKAGIVEHVGSSSKSNPKIKEKGKGKNDKKSKGKVEYLALKAGILKQKFQGTCYNYDQPGHRAANCKLPKRVTPHQANMVNDNVDMIAMVSNVVANMLEVNMVSSNNSDWWVDIGVTHHVCTDKIMFHFIRVADNKEKLYMGNSATANIKGEGDVILKMTSKKELKLTNVLYVSDICKNLVSGWLLNKFGFCLAFEYDKFVLSKECPECNDKIIKSTKDMLKSKFDMKDMCLADVFLRVKIIRTQNGLVLSQAHYVDTVLNTYNAMDSDLARTLIDTSIHLSKIRGSGRVAGFVVDMFCTCMTDVANEFNVPTYVFFTSNAAYLGFKLYIQTLNDDQNQDVTELSLSDTEMPDGRRLRDVKAIMVNTYNELEAHAMESLSADKTVPPVYPVGPILNLENSAIDDDLITWLDSQPPFSVVFLCFGSTGIFDEVQVKEIARGLERSGYRFVWSLRRPPSNQASKAPSDYEDPSVVLPEGFLERTAEQGKVIGWAPQVTLLGHQAVGGFVSHCRWNSLLESLWFGVPSATWPIYAEQQINAFDMVAELELAVEIKLDYKQNMSSANADKNNRVIVTAEEIESGIRRLMEDNEIRTKVKEMSAKSRAAVTEGGSFYMAIGSLIQDFVRNLS
uniref:Anthocyanidin 3-O-glucosyltransferase 2-like n=1 Tax=Tanacetum cinerariifolium TaxID=118510 RepID=A0A699H305_TANCI|nr:anthocyanidin 3-O-glucosyltransferase 2-like [Tanacetum cinerariifolium]